MEKHRGNRQTNVLRICYTSLYTFFISTVLNEYCNAKNESSLPVQGNTSTALPGQGNTLPGQGNTLLGQGNMSDLYQILDHSTWMKGYNDCRNIYNMTMASSFDINDNSKLFLNIDSHLPVWIYAFEVVLTRGKVLRIQSNEVSKYNNTYHCSNQDGVTLTRCCKSLIQAKDLCRDKNMTLRKITPQTTVSFAQNLYINATIWAIDLDVSAFLKENASLKVRCLLWDQNGLRKDECTKAHRTLCIQGDSQAVIQYVNKEKIPEYTPSTTTRHSSSKSPGSPSKQDFNNTNQSTTVSSSTNQVPVYQDIWMDPLIRYSLIAVGSVICIVLLVAVCCCFCKYRRRSENRKTSAHLAEAYSETADSIVMKETSVYETADTSQYAIPEDALKKARHRKSIGENEYDVLQKTNKTPKNYTGNAYNHVTLVTEKDRRGSSNQEENMYDVTNYGKQNAVIISPSELTGNLYGDVDLKTTTIEKKEKKGS